MKVIALPEVREYLMELIQILYKKEYFGFEENAQKYVEELIFDIKNNLPLKLNKRNRRQQYRFTCTHSNLILAVVRDTACAFHTNKNHK